MVVITDMETVTRLDNEMAELGRAITSVKVGIEKHQAEVGILARKRDHVLAEISTMEGGIDTMATEINRIVRRADGIVQQVEFENKKISTMTGEMRGVKGRLDTALDFWQKQPGKAKELQDVTEAATAGATVLDAMVTNAQSNNIEQALAPMKTAVTPIRNVPATMKQQLNNMIKAGLDQIGNNLESLQQTLAAMLDNVTSMQDSVPKLEGMFNQMKTSNFPPDRMDEQMTAAMNQFRDFLPGMSETLVSMEEVKTEMKKALQQIEDALRPMSEHVVNATAILVPIDQAITDTMNLVLKPLEKQTASMKEGMRELLAAMAGIKLDDKGALLPADIASLAGSPTSGQSTSGLESSVTPTPAVKDVQQTSRKSTAPVPAKPSVPAGPQRRGTEPAPRKSVVKSEPASSSKPKAGEKDEKWSKKF